MLKSQCILAIFTVMFRERWMSRSLLKFKFTSLTRVQKEVSFRSFLPIEAKVFKAAFFEGARAWICAKSVNPTRHSFIFGSCGIRKKAKIKTQRTCIIADVEATTLSTSYFNLYVFLVV